MLGETYLPLACYGKLPFWPEYLQHGASYPSSRVLRDWLHQGRMESGLDSAEGAGVPDETRSRRFVYGEPKSLEVLAGVVRPSRDQGDLRAFPFAVFVHIPRRFFGRHHFLIPLCLEPVWEALEDAWDALSSCAERDSFEEVLKEHRVPGPPAPSALRASFDAGLRQASDRLFEGRPEVGIEALASGFPPALRAVRDVSNGGSVAVAFPVSSSCEDRAFDAAFWMDLLAHQFFWRRVDPWLFLDAKRAAAEPEALLVVGELEAGLYPGVMTAADGDARVYRPCKTDPAHPDAGPAPSFGELLRRKFGP